MLRKAASRIAWVGRTASMVFGLALTLALLLGLGTAALAAVPGDPLKLGRMNAIDVLTTISGTANNALLRIANDGKGENATALELRVDPKRPPMKTNSLTQVENLHADLLDGKSASQFANGLGDGTAELAANAEKLDGKDSTTFFSGKTYTVKEGRVGGGGDAQEIRLLSCDEGDKVLGGGGQTSQGIEDTLAISMPIERDSAGRVEGWNVIMKDNGFASFIEGRAVCVDFPPLRQ